MWQKRHFSQPRIYKYTVSFKIKKLWNINKQNHCYMKERAYSLYAYRKVKNYVINFLLIRVEQQLASSQSRNKSYWRTLTTPTVSPEWGNKLSTYQDYKCHSAPSTWLQFNWRLHSSKETPKSVRNKASGKLPLDTLYLLPRPTIEMQAFVLIL